MLQLVVDDIYRVQLPLVCRLISYINQITLIFYTINKNTHLNRYEITINEINHVKLVNTKLKFS